MLDELKKQIASGLKRKALKTCSKWAQTYIVMGKPFPGPLTFKYHPWTREMHDSQAERNVGKKAAQMGYTVAMMHRAFYTIDILRESVLYLLPSKTPDATDFSATKFDPALEMSPHLNDLFNDVKNVATKRAGSSVLYIRGSNSRVGLKSISVSNVFADEFDEMPEHTVPLAQERMSGQPNKTLWLISTPRFPGMGIDREYQDTTKEHFFFKCPSCNKQIELHHENLVITAEDIYDPKINESYIKCSECKKPLTNHNDTEAQYRERKAHMLESGVWIPTGHSDFGNRGFYINQLYSPTIRPKHLATAYLKSLTSKAAEQEYHNSKMGDAHEVEGSRVTSDLLDMLIENSRGRQKSSTYMPGMLMTMGVDVGRWLHVEVNAWYIRRVGNDINAMTDCILVWEGKVDMFRELDELMKRYQIMHCVIDANPERRKATEFAKRFWGHVSLCFYARGLSGKSLSIETQDSGDFKINVDRTMWLDTSLGRFHRGTIDLPRDLSLEYRTHIRNIARIYEEDKDGNQIGRYINNGDDHFAHARTYSEIALPLAASISHNTDVGKLL